MRRRTPDVFDTAVQKSNIWLRDIQEAGHLRSRFQAYAALRSVLHALRDCLPAGEVAKLAAQMPLLVKGVFYDGWKFTPKPLRLSREGFQALVRRTLRDQAGLDPTLAVRSVLTAMYQHVTPPMVDAMQYVLPREVRAYIRDQVCVAGGSAAATPGGEREAAGRGRPRSPSQPRPASQSGQGRRSRGLPPRPAQERAGPPARRSPPRGAAPPAEQAPETVDSYGE